MAVKIAGGSVLTASSHFIDHIKLYNSYREVSLFHIFIFHSEPEKAKSPPGFEVIPT